MSTIGYTAVGNQKFMRSFSTEQSYEGLKVRSQKFGIRSEFLIFLRYWMQNHGQWYWGSVRGVYYYGIDSFNTAKNQELWPNSWFLRPDLSYGKDKFVNRIAYFNYLTITIHVIR